MTEANFSKSEIDVICVQSTKGGVGKTLLSLLTAHLLTEKELQRDVLWVDLDFTGTSVADIAALLKKKEEAGDSEEFHNIKFHNVSFGIPRGDNQQTILQLFENYLLAKPIEKKWNEALFSKNNGKIIHIPSGKTYLPDNGNANLQESVLFDATHADWFVDFLLDFFKSLADKQLNVESNRRFTVVLDNSPGQSAALSRLQHQLLRRPEFRPTFIQVASPDEMDIRASVELIDKLHRSAHHILRTRRCIDDFRSLNEADRVKAWGKLLQAAQTEGEVDRELLEAELGVDCSDKAADKRTDQGRGEPRMVLLVNKVMGQINLQRIDMHLCEIIEDITKKNKYDKAPGLLERLPRGGLRFDPVLALFFQQRYMNQWNIDPDVPEAPSAVTDSHETAPAGENSALKNLEEMLEADKQVYRALWGQADVRDEDTIRGLLIRKLDHQTVSHSIRGSVVMARVVELCRRIVAARLPKLNVTPDVVEDFCDNLIRAWKKYFDASVRDEAGVAVSPLRQQSFIHNVMSQKIKNYSEPSDQNPGITEEMLSSIKELTSHYDTFESEFPYKFLNEVFEIFACHLAYPNDMIQKTSGSSIFILKQERINVYRLILEMSRQLVTGGLTGASVIQISRELDALIVKQEKEDVKLAGDIQHFHFDLAQVVASVHALDRSLKHGAAASRLLVDLAAGQQGKSLLSLSPLATLYVHTGLEALFSGWREDVDGVRREVENLLRRTKPQEEGRSPTGEIENMIMSTLGFLFPKKGG